MDKKTRLGRNIIANIAQVLISSVLLFGLYRYINDTLGIEQLGVWSAVLATASASRLVDLGLSTGLTRFVARYLAHGDQDRALQVIDTVFLGLTIVAGTTLTVLYPALSILFHHLFDNKHLFIALEVLPYALISLWLTILGSVFQGALEGCRRMDLRAIQIVTGQALLLVLAIILLPSLGLVGLAYAQVGQAFISLVMAQWFLRRSLPGLGILPYRWRWSILREIFGYGVNVQVASVFMLLFDPIAKVLMTKYGGPVGTGYFEIANQVVQKVRALIVSANQAIVPYVVELNENKPSQLTRLYQNNMRLLIVLTLPIFSLLVAWSGLISWLLTGEYNSQLEFLIILLSITWGVNIFAGPAYFSNLGTGHVGFNTLSHVLMGIINVCLSWALGTKFGWVGVATGYAVALVVGSVFLIAIHEHHLYRTFQREKRFGSLYDQLWLVVLSVVIVVYSIYTSQADSELFFKLIGWILPPIVFACVLWRHPVKYSIFNILGQKYEK